MQLLCIYLCLHPTTHLKSWPGAKCAQLQNDAYLFLALKQRRNCAARSYTSAVAAVLWTLAFYWPPINLPGPQTTQSNLGRKNDRCLKLKTQLKLWVKAGQGKVTKWDTGPLCFRGRTGLGGWDGALGAANIFMWSSVNNIWGGGRGLGLGETEEINTKRVGPNDYSFLWRRGYAEVVSGG